MAHKILVVDDDPNALRLVSYAFQAEGYQVATAASGADALARLAQEKPDLMVLDVMMPDMSGIEVCQRVRANPATARLPILMLSARGLVADRVNGLKSGADDYLPKPADTSELLARAESLLARASYTAVPSGQVLAFMGVKGGVGTTTVAVNVGAQLASLGKSVCLLELRPSIGTAPMLLRLQPAHHLGELAAKPAAELTSQDIQGRIVAHVSGLRILAAPQAADAPCLLATDLVNALLDHLLSAMDYVLLDLPAAWTPANQAALRRARFTALLCEPDQLSVRCAKAMLLTLRNWGTMGDLVGLIIVNRGGNPAPLTVPAIRAETETAIIAALPPAPDVFLIAAREGTPLVTLQPQHTAAMALKDLASRLLADRVRPLA